MVRRRRHPHCLVRWVEQVVKDLELLVLPFRLHQRGQVLGVGLESIYVRFSDNALVSLPPYLLRLLPTRQASADAHDTGHRTRERPYARDHPHCY